MRGLILLVFFVSSCAMATESGKNTVDVELGLVHVKSNFTVKETTQRLLKILKNKNMTVFNEINHTENAKKASMKLPPTQLIIFGNPKIGTKLMQCSPSVAIDLPLKFTVHQGENSQVWITYNSPHYLVTRHNIEGCEKVIKKMAGALKAISSKASTKI